MNERLLVRCETCGRLTSNTKYEGRIICLYCLQNVVMDRAKELVMKGGKS